MRADDDGFVGNPKTIQRIAGTKASDLESLVKKRFLLQFPSGVVVIKHWKINNQIQKDRYTPTVYTEEYQSLYIKDNKAYTEMDKGCIQSVSEMDTQISIDKSRLDKNSRGGEKHAHGFFANVLLTDEEMQKLADEIPNYEEYIEKLSHYIESNGKKYKSHYATILMWRRKDREKQPAAPAEILPQAPRRKSL
jgi:Asp-tRNA(Asn)/Glu-tRNA(Gln) amidotransferase C subunit